MESVVKDEVDGEQGEKGPSLCAMGSNSLRRIETKIEKGIDRLFRLQ